MEGAGLTMLSACGLIATIWIKAVTETSTAEESDSESGIV